MNELLPCPFCEAEAAIYQINRGIWVAGCTACPARMGVTYTSEDDAVKAWNRRPSPFDDAVMGEG